MTNSGGIQFDFSDNTAGVNVNGGTYGDVLLGGSGDDTLNGGDGDDVLSGGTGTNTINGGSGSNTADYEYYQSNFMNFAGVNVNLGTQTARDDYQPAGTTFTDTLNNIQNIRGSAFRDVLTGDSNNNVFEGGAGPDVINGGGGSDTASYAHSSAGVTVNLNLAPGTGQTSGGDASGDQLTGITNLIGSAYNDILVGNTGNSLQVVPATTSYAFRAHPRWSTAVTAPTRFR